MIARGLLVAGLATALSLIGGSAIAYPITGIIISLPANPDANLRVGVSDADGNFVGQARAPAGEYTVSTVCAEAATCAPMRITALMIDGRKVSPSSDGLYRLSIRNPRQMVSFSGTVVPADSRRR